MREKKICGCLFGFLILVLGACGPDAEIIVKGRVADRVNAFRIKKTAECRASLLQKAGETADSLLIKEAIEGLNDSLARLRPGRPYRPAPIPPIDTAVVKPIFEE